MRLMGELARFSSKPSDSLQFPCLENMRKLLAMAAEALPIRSNWPLREITGNKRLFLLKERLLDLFRVEHFFLGGNVSPTRVLLMSLSV